MVHAHKIILRRMLWYWNLSALINTPNNQVIIRGLTSVFVELCDLLPQTLSGDMEEKQEVLSDLQIMKAARHFGGADCFGFSLTESLDLLIDRISRLYTE